MTSTLRDMLMEAACNALQENLDSSKEMIQQNVVPSFEDMGMATTPPGEFSPEEITDKQNLVNTAEMSNDTDFEGKATNSENSAEDMMQAVDQAMNDLVNISVGSDECEHCHREHDKPEEEIAKMHVLEFGESTMANFVYEVLGGKTCEQYLRTLNESNYAGPLDYVPDLRFNAADVTTALKNEIGKGSEAIHVDAIYDDRKNRAFKVSQIDKNLLPKRIQVENVLLELDDDNVYHANKPSDAFPLAK